MRTSPGVLIVAAIFCTAPPAWAAGGGAARMPEPRIAVQTPEQRARSDYNAGVRMLKKADSLAAESGRGADVRKQQKAAGRANDAYRKALGKFENAVSDAPSMHEAWNYVGYTKRKLGEFDGALAAYDRALAIRPGYPQAVEYRGEAYLALNRLNDAKQAYLDLYAGDRKLSDQLLVAMQEWIGRQRASASIDDAAAFDEFEQWVRERVAIAGQTAALTREGTASSWN